MYLIRWSCHIHNISSIKKSQWPHSKFEKAFHIIYMQDNGDKDNASYMMCTSKILRRCYRLHM